MGALDERRAATLRFLLRADKLYRKDAKKKRWLSKLGIGHWKRWYAVRHGKRLPLLSSLERWSRALDLDWYDIKTGTPSDPVNLIDATLRAYRHEPSRALYEKLAFTMFQLFRQEFTCDFFLSDSAEIVIPVKDQIRYAVHLYATEDSVRFTATMMMGPRVGKLHLSGDCILPSLTALIASVYRHTRYGNHEPTCDKARQAAGKQTRSIEWQTSHQQHQRKHQKP